MLLSTTFVLLTVGQFEPTAAGRGNDLRMTRNVVYARRDGRDLLMDVYQPPGDGPFPAVLMVHGGAWAVGSRWQMTHHARYVATRGYVVGSIDYRLAPTHKFPAQLDDCREAVRWLRRQSTRYRVDPRRMAGYGYSAGGHLVCLMGLAGATEPEARLQAVIAGGAPCDFRDTPKDQSTLSYFLGGTRQEKPDVYRQASPAEFLSPGDPPTLFFHGTKDRLVPLDSVRGMHERMKELGIHTELVLVREKGHVGAFFDAEPPRRAVQFLDQVLKPDPENARSR